MEKIPTMFERDAEDPSLVTRRVTPGCEWVLAGEGWATRKYDGTNVRVTIGCDIPVERGRALVLATLEKRRNPTREEKAAGAEPGYVPAARTDPADKHIFRALDATEFAMWPPGSWSCEAVGPKIQGGVECMEPTLVPFSTPGWPAAHAVFLPGRGFEDLRLYLVPGRIEGLVFHHPDGRMAKIKARDFDLGRLPCP